MLVIRRHAGQSIIVGDGIEIRVIESGPNRVKLGIEAPREVPVYRKEVEMTREANLAAARPLTGLKLAGVLDTLRQNRAARHGDAAGPTRGAPPGGAETTACAREEELHGGARA